MDKRERTWNIVSDAGRGLLITVVLLYPLLAGKNFRWQNAIIHVLVVLAALLWSAGQVQTGKSVRVIRYRALDYSLLVLLGLILIAIIPSVYRYAGVLFVAWFIDCLIVYWVAREAFVEPRWRMALTVAFVSTGAICALMGLREYSHTVIFAGDATWRIFGPLYNPNILASYLIGPLLAALGLVMYSLGQRKEPAETVAPARGSYSGRSSKRRQPVTVPVSSERPRFGLILQGVAVVLLVPALLLTGSKAGLLAFLVGLGVFMFAGAAKRRRGRMAVVFALLVVVMVGAVSALPPIRKRVTEAFSLQTHSTAFRYYTWLGTVDMLADNPLLGTGPGTFEYAYPKYARAGFTRTAHETYLQVGAEAGAIALLAMVVTGIAAIILLWRRAQSNAISEDDAARFDRSMCAAAVGWIVALAVHNLADYSLYVPAVTVTAFLVLGIALSAGGTMPQIQNNRLMMPVLSLLLVGALWIAAGELCTTRAEALTDMGNVRAAQATAARATTILPVSAEAWEVRAEAFEATITGPDVPAMAQAIDAWQRVAQLAPTHTKPLLALAQLNKAANKPAKALEAAEKSVELYPSNARGLAELAEAQFALGMKDDTKRTYEAMLALLDEPVGKYPAVPEMPDLSYVWAWTYLATEAYAASDVVTGEQMVYDALKLLYQRLLAQDQMFALQMEMSGQRPREMMQIAAMADGLGGIVAKHPDSVNRLRLADVWRKLQRDDVQENLLLDVIGSGDDASADNERLYIAVAHFMLGECYAGRDEKYRATIEWSEGLRLLENIPADVVERVGADNGRTPVGAERFATLRSQAAGE